MDTERFAVPELLFQPSDIGINQAGIVEATWQSLQKLPMVRNKQYLAHMHLENICLHTDSHTDMHTNINIFSFVAHFVPHTIHPPYRVYVRLHTCNISSKCMRTYT